MKSYEEYLNNQKIHNRAQYNYKQLSSDNFYIGMIPNLNDTKRKSTFDPHGLVQKLHVFICNAFTHNPSDDMEISLSFKPIGDIDVGIHVEPWWCTGTYKLPLTRNHDILQEVAIRFQNELISKEWSVMVDIIHNFWPLMPKLRIRPCKNTGAVNSVHNS